MTLEGKERNEMKLFYSNITIIPLNLKNINNDSSLGGKFLLQLKIKLYIFLCCKAIHASHIYFQQNK